MASCFYCGGPLGACDTWSVCYRCNQIAALKVLGDQCPSCEIDFAYDNAGHFVPIHEGGCAWLADFNLKARIIADDDRGNTDQPPRPG
jgi:hypothetical protein